MKIIKNQWLNDCGVILEQLTCTRGGTLQATQGQKEMYE